MTTNVSLLNASVVSVMMIVVDGYMVLCVTMGIWREGGRERGREGGREGEREEGREGEWEGGREGWDTMRRINEHNHFTVVVVCTSKACLSRGTSLSKGVAVDTKLHTYLQYLNRPSDSWVEKQQQQEEEEEEEEEEGKEEEKGRERGMP